MACPGNWPQVACDLCVRPFGVLLLNSPSAFRLGEGLPGLKYRGKAVFAGHRFYDFHASVARIDLFAGPDHSRPL
jgi:hypothetical protein